MRTDRSWRTCHETRDPLLRTSVSGTSTSCSSRAPARAAFGANSTRSLMPDWSATPVNGPRVGLHVLLAPLGPVKLAVEEEAGEAEARCGLHSRLVDVAANGHDDPERTWRIEAA